MPKRKTTHAFFPLFDRFIRDSKTGCRIQPNGKRIASGTLENYRCTKQLLETFCTAKGFVLCLPSEKSLTKRDSEVEKAYWKKFYRAFTDYLYDERSYFDNYVGATIRILKTFFNYLNKDLVLGVGNFHKQFYVRREAVAIWLLLTTGGKRCSPYRNVGCAPPTCKPVRVSDGCC